MKTQIETGLRALLLAAMALTMTGCGDEGSIGSGGNTATNPADPTDPTDPADPTDPGDDTVALRMGALDDNTFTQGLVAVSQSPIADGVSTTLRVDIVDTDGQPFTDASISVSFDATCESAALVSPVTTGANGRASTTYTPDAACAGPETITASASFQDQNLSAQGDLEVRVVRLGNLEGGSFTEGEIFVGVDPIATRGSSGLRVAVVDENDAVVSDQTFSVAFASSICSEDASLDSPVSTVNGVANSTFEDAGCASGAQVTDTLTATTTAFGKSLSATGSLTIQPADLGALEFVAADPTVIGLRGTGGQGVQETSTVTFLLRDDVGDPVEGQTVDFSLDRSSGGVELSDTQGISNAEGRVSVVVRSGTVHTTVRVRAQATDPNSGETISSQSDQLVITSGIADNDSFSLTAECFNLEAFDYDGVTTGINIRLADRFNNPVPEGTAVAFTTEEGSIDGQCFVDATGACSVEWRSQGVRPGDGRTTVLAVATGEESFFDANGDGVHQDGEQQASTQDLPEAFLDRDEDGTYDALGFNGNGRQTPNRPATDIAADSNVDFNSNNVHDSASGAFTGLLCESGCDDPNNGTLLNVRDSLVLIFSGSEAFQDGGFIDDNDGFNDSLLILDQTGASPSPDTDPDNDGFNEFTLTNSSGDFDSTMNLGQPPGSDNPEDFVPGASIGVVLRDQRGQPLPFGTTVSIETDVGTAQGITEFEVLCTTSDALLSGLYTFFIDGPDTDAEPDAGAIRITVTTPRGIIKTFTYSVDFNPIAAETP